jgi:hypothetical protein
MPYVVILSVIMLNFIMVSVIPPFVTCPRGHYQETDCLSTDTDRVGSSESISTASSSCGDVSAIVSPTADLADASGQQLLCVVCGDTR